MGRLESYRAKRDPGRTPEPVPEPAPEPVSEPGGDNAVDHTGDEQDGRGDSFVVQEHHATALHWDVRLERDGVLVSWAVPKGFPLDPATNHLAKQTEDHPLDYAGFEGEIPKGEYGGGAVAVWDRGSYRLEKWRPDKVQFVLSGKRISGRYIFFRTHDRDWMLHRMDPSPAGWAPLPEGLRPMTSRPGRLPRNDDRWSYEVGWGGARVLVAVYGGRLTVTEHTGRAVTSYPELRGLGLQLGSTQVLLDGEVVVLTDEGTQDTTRLASRADSPKPGAALLRTAPVQFVAYDVLHLDGESLLPHGFDERRHALESLSLTGSHWQTAPAFRGGGKAVRDAARERGLPAIVAKRRDSPYRPGRRSDDWRSIPA